MLARLLDGLIDCLLLTLGLIASSPKHTVHTDCHWLSDLAVTVLSMSFLPAVCLSVLPDTDTDKSPMTSATIGGETKLSIRVGSSYQAP